MKLLIITAIREDMNTVSSILSEAAVAVFSISETVGHKTGQKDNMTDNWFGHTGDGTDALVFFSFTDGGSAQAVLEAVKEFNRKTSPSFPIRAFICPVEQSSY